MRKKEYAALSPEARCIAIDGLCRAAGQYAKHGDYKMARKLLKSVARLAKSGPVRELQPSRP